MKGHVQTFVLTRNAWTEGIDPVSVTSSFVISDITCKRNFAHCFKTQKEFYAPIHCSCTAKRKKSIDRDLYILKLSLQVFERRKSFPKQIDYTEYFIHRAILNLTNKTTRWLLTKYSQTLRSSLNIELISLFLPSRCVIFAKIET